MNTQEWYDFQHPPVEDQHTCTEGHQSGQRRQQPARGSKTAADAASEQGKEVEEQPAAASVCDIGREEGIWEDDVVTSDDKGEYEASDSDTENAYQ